MRVDRKRENRIRYAVTVITLGWMAVIFWFSAQPAVQSAAMSGGILQKIQEMMAEIPVMGAVFVSSFTEHVLRKGAHMAEYAILGILLLLCVRQYAPEWRRWLQTATAWMLATLYAGSDELHQRFVPGRSGELRDVLLDSIGAGIGLAVISVIFACIRGKKEVY